MVRDALRGYVQLASGLTDVTKEKARSAAKALVEQVTHLGSSPGDAREQVKALADDLALTARANRDLVLGMVKTETERAVAALGLASDDDLAALRRRVVALEARLATRERTAAAVGDDQPPSAPATPGDRLPAAGTAPAKKAPAKAAAAKPTAAKKTPAKKVAGAPVPTPAEVAARVEGSA